MLLPRALASSLLDRKTIKATAATMLTVAVKPRAAIVLIVVIVEMVTVEIIYTPCYSRLVRSIA
jgi:hypothetical protein